MITEAKIESVEGIPYDHDYTVNILSAGAITIAFVELIVFVSWIWSGVG